MIDVHVRSQMRGSVIGDCYATRKLNVYYSDMLTCHICIVHELQYLNSVLSQICFYMESGILFFFVYLTLFMHYR